MEEVKRFHSTVFVGFSAAAVVGRHWTINKHTQQHKSSIALPIRSNGCVSWQGTMDRVT